LQLGSSKLPALPVIPFADLRDQRWICESIRSAKLRGIEEVVVKTSHIGSSDKASTAQELRVIRHVSPSPHLVRLLGLCVDAPDGELGIVMEHCEHGSLGSFLEEHWRHNVRKGRGCVYGCMRAYGIISESVTQ
jgi:hypothetical protein